MSISLLPTELLVKIFNYLCIETQIRVEATCFRWRNIIIQNFFLPFLLRQPYSIRKNYLGEGWVDKVSNSPEKIRKLFYHVYHDLPRNWREGGFKVQARKQIAEYSPGHDQKISSIAVYQDKIYLGRPGYGVEVLDSLKLSSIRTLDTRLDPAEEDLQESRRPCKVYEHGRTLAVLGPDRTRVLLFNTRTDEMVGAIDTALGSIYHVAISEKLLILLSGWSIFYWRIDSWSPERVRGEFRGCIPDFENDAHFKTWLESHEAVVNSSWLVTRATRMGVLEEGGGLKMKHFLHVRQVYPSGTIGPVLRPNSSRLPDTVYEMTSMALSEADLLAVGYRVLDKGEVCILDLNTGDTIHNITSEYFLASIQIPLKFDGSKLFLKIIPITRPTNDECGASIGYLDLKSKEVVEVPGISLNSSEDVLHLEPAQLYTVATKLERVDSQSEFSHIDLNMDLEAFALIESENEDFAPVYSVTVTVLDFWNSSSSPSSSSSSHQTESYDSTSFSTSTSSSHPNNPSSSSSVFHRNHPSSSS
ncbi:uncharacterized protein LOC111706869 [Eurytemora carolleeae]|uniref:uncharacterized protein LOC111706869 n=1 Tax=Eurytemora carolleeae TaxID=1294199 RepID=UPI000C78673B|nr:uncharacterized protein LOC111706869 [Eurytemora carolleeae]|eukprot:XP_023335569.1 uncharacterized protein LOC111706869 [Eurytemora affinis]